MGDSLIKNGLDASCARFDSEADKSARLDSEADKSAWLDSEYDFDAVIDRKDTDSYKWDGLDIDDDVIPMWVADMDFACPPPIYEAMCRRAQHPIYGYTLRTERYYKAVEKWLRDRHGFEPPQKYLTFSPPGVIYAMNVALKLLTSRGDKILVHTPNYDPLYSIVKNNGRILVESPLRQVEGGVSGGGGGSGGYGSGGGSGGCSGGVSGGCGSGGVSGGGGGGRFVMDFDELERHAKEGLAALILCSPHNPTGRVWDMEELEKIAGLCLRYNIFMLVDEIHADFTSKLRPHITFGKLGDKVLQQSIICYSANKGFNLGGLQMATVVIANDALREKFDSEMDTAQTRLDNIFGAEALIAAYEHGEGWLDAAISYVECNKTYVREFLKKNVPAIKWTLTEGTYFGWLDCKGLALYGKELERFMIDKARVALSPGYGFGPGGEAFMRINLACPKSCVEEAMRRIGRAVKERLNSM